MSGPNKGGHFLVTGWPVGEIASAKGTIPESLLSLHSILTDSF